MLEHLQDMDIWGVFFKMVVSWYTSLHHPVMDHDLTWLRDGNRQCFDLGDHRDVVVHGIAIRGGAAGLGMAM